MAAEKNEVINELEIIKSIGQETKIQPKQIQVVLNLLSEGSTIPFIARYRKDQTGSLDEVQIRDIEQRYRYQMNLAERREEVQRLIAEQDKLTDALAQEISQATTLQQLEDLYRPYKQTRRTKATIAREQGLEPLALWLKTGGEGEVNAIAEQYLSEEVETIEDALQGAHEILAEEVGNHPQFRDFIRKYMAYNAILTTTVKDEERDPQGVYSQYYDYQEPVQQIVEHRILAINRAEKEDVITVKIELDEVPAINYMIKRYIMDELTDSQRERVEEAIRDAYKRFIFPALERELRNSLSERAGEQAIKVFGDNVQNLLLQPPMKGQVVMGFDPAYRTGCKLAIVDPTGKVLDKAIIYPHLKGNSSRKEKAVDELLKLIQKYKVDIIAIGNGTASRESEKFVAEVIQNHQLDTKYIVISEAGASVYSASAIAREEFPDYEVEERSAVSIARRLQDPLAELIKIDPKSMGVGQYQHDVNQKDLNEQLDFVVNITVNKVGVDINTASAQLLEHVSGMTAATAKNTIALRNEIGHFNNRRQIKEIKRLGPKTYEQAVGFLRIIGGDNPLDSTGIHPESYDTAVAILADLGLTLDTIGSESTTERILALKASEVAEKHQIGEATAEDILQGLAHPLADIREGQAAPTLRSDVLTMEDLEVGMELEGIVRNVVDFGAFVDIGVKQDGLIHISQLSNRYIKHPSEAVAVGDIVQVEVISLDLDKERIGLKRLK